MEASRGRVGGMDAGYDGLLAELTGRVIGCAIKVHRTLGPGFVESVYENALVIELASQGIAFEEQKLIELTYEGQAVGAHRLDLFVDGRLVVELKAKEQLSDADRATTLSYLKATGTRVGLILNFGTAKLDAKRMIRKQYSRSTPTLP